MSRSIGRAALIYLAWAVAAVAVWVVIASLAFLEIAGLWDMFPIWRRPWQWIVYARLFGRSYSEIAYLVLAAAIATAPFLLYLRYVVSRLGGFRLRFRQNKQKIVRGGSDNHGHADYMSDDEVRTIFKMQPHPELGGLAMGELGRIDLSPIANIPFDSRDERTWGNGGKMPVMYDHCTIGSTHAAIIGGSGSFKSWRLTAAMLSWRSSLFCLDPSGELADRVGDEIENTGRRVVTLNVGGSGPNVLEGIDPADPFADTYIDAIVGRISGPSSGESKDDKFREWGKEILKAFLCHIIYDPSIPAERKTLRTLREALEGDDETVRSRLCGIAATSESATARSLASTWHDKTKDTYDGALLNATGATEWLASEAYAGLVSDGAYDMRDLTSGKLAVFCQVPQFVLDHKAVIARVLTGCHIDAVIRADGAVSGRVWIPIDEAVLIGDDPSIRTVLNQGRKYRMTLWLLYQSEWQVSRIWGADGREEFYDSLAWRSYTGFRSLKSAKEMSEVMGSYGARAISTGSNKGRSGRRMQIAGTNSKGENASEHEISRELAKVYELLTEMRGDETITVVSGRKVIRHGAALPFRRLEMKVLLGDTRHEVNQIESATRTAAE